MHNPFALPVILATIVYSLLGTGLLVVGFYIVDRFVPTDIWHEIVAEKNTALAIVVAGFVIAVGLIIQSVVRG